MSERESGGEKVRVRECVCCVWCVRVACVCV